MTKMLSASGWLQPPDQGLCPWTPLGALPPDPRYRLVLRTRHGAPQPLTPSAAYVHNCPRSTQLSNKTAKLFIAVASQYIGAGTLLRT